ncbi:hypothetical protein Tco_1084615 [Tanacetum coccineum]
MFEVTDSNMPEDQEGNPGDNDDEPRKEDASRRDWFKKPTPPQDPTDPDWHEGKIPQKGPTQKLLKGTRSNYAELEYDFEEYYKALSKKLDWENPEGGDYLFDLSKPLPLITRGKRQRVPFEYFINNDLKYLQGGVSTMTYTTSTTKTKAAQVSHIGENKVMRKHGYGYLEEIVVRRADNVLYIFKEGDFPRLWINDIKDMLLLVVQNRLTNLSGDDVADFAIALRMFTRSLVIQKQVKDLQLGVESYQKQINVTKPDTTRPEYRHRVLVKEKMKHIGKEKSSFHNQGHQQATKGKEDDEEFGEICWR